VSEAAAEPRPKAVLVAVQLPGVDDREHESSISELERLADTLGLDVVARMTQRRPELAAAAVLGEGKLTELAKLTGGSGDTAPKIPRKAPKARARFEKRRSGSGGVGDADDEARGAHGGDGDGDGVGDGVGEGDGAVDAAGATGDRDRRGDDAAKGEGGLRPTVVLVDHDLSPSQARNLERATGAEVLDRSAVILAIFHRHARTREARLQVELARLAYMTPRLRESHAGGDRQRGGIGGKGAGESALGLDRRRVRDRMAELREQLAALATETATRRGRRAEQATVALVGYTNAGKSSLFRGLTGSDVYVANALFATLDTTVRALDPATKPRILVSDTVGFIKKLPHDLVASFRSTLAEAREADLLIHVVDGSDPAFEAQLEVTREVLGELGALETPRWLVLNKMDLVPALDRRVLLARHPGAIPLSAHHAPDVAALHAHIVEHFERGMEDAELFVPHAAQRHIGRVHETCRVLGEKWDEDGATLTVRAPAATLAELRATLAGAIQAPRSSP